MIRACFVSFDRTMIPSKPRNQQQNGQKKKRMEAFQWLISIRLESRPQTPDIEMLWQDFKKAVHIRMPANVNELKQRCEEERAKIPPQLLETLIKWETDTVMQKQITSNYCCKRCFNKLMNHEVYNWHVKHHLMSNPNESDICLPPCISTWENSGMRFVCEKGYYIKLQGFF